MAHIILTDIMQSIVDSMVVEIDGIKKNIYFQPGRSTQIIEELNKSDDSIHYKGTKYPLIAMVLPSPITRGGSGGFYGKVRIPELVIATLSNDTDNVKTRFLAGGTFKKTLYPCYYEFIKRLVMSEYIVEQEIETISHTLLDNPGVQPIGDGGTDYIDSLKLLNLEFTISQLKNCL